MLALRIRQEQCRLQLLIDQSLKYPASFEAYFGMHLLKVCVELLGRTRVTSKGCDGHSEGCLQWRGTCPVAIAAWL